MAPSSPTFAPIEVTFESEPNKTVNFSSSDGILETNDIGEAQIYLNGTLVPYQGNTAKIGSSYFSFESSDDGEVVFLAYADAGGTKDEDYEGTLNVTKIIFGGKEYLTQ